MKKINIVILLVVLLLALQLGCSSSGGEGDTDDQTSFDSESSGEDTDDEIDDSDSFIGDSDTSKNNDSETGFVNELSGYVILQGQADFSGIAVTLDSTNFDTVTDATGFYKFENIPGDTYTITASLSGYSEISSSAFEVEESKDFTVDTITLEETRGSLSGVVTFENQSEHSGISVSIESTSFATTTDSNGLYSFENVPTGNYSIIISATGYVEVTVSDQQVDANQNKDVATQVLVMKSDKTLTYVSGGSIGDDPMQTGVVATSLTEPFTVKVTNVLGEPEQSVLVSFAIVKGNGTLTSYIVSTDENGEAETNLLLGTISGENSVLASVSDEQVAFVANGTADSPVTIVLEGDNQEGVVGEELDDLLVATLFDQYDNPVPGVEISFTPDSNCGDVSESSSFTDETGVASTSWTLGTLLNQIDPYEQKVVVDVTGYSLSGELTATNVADDVLSLSIVSGDDQLGKVDAQLADQLVVYAEDQYGNPAYENIIDWSAITSGASVYSADLKFDIEGYARASVSLGSVVGEYQFGADAGGESVTFVANGTVHNIDYLFPQRAWFGIPVDVEIEIMGTGFDENSIVIFDVGGADLPLAKTFANGRLTAVIPSGSLTGENRTVPITVKQGGVDCAVADFVLGKSLPDTGADKCYNNIEEITCPAEGEPFYGQDAQYGMDLEMTIADRYKRVENNTENPVVLDIITSTISQGCQNGLTGPTCSGSTVERQNWSDAVLSCNSSTWDNLTSWRLPSIYEISDFGICNVFLESSIFGPLNSALFSADKVLDYSQYAEGGWILGVSSGFHITQTDIIVPGGTDYEGYFFCVNNDREDIGFLTGDTISGDIVVKDLDTALMWKPCLAGLSGELCDVGLVLDKTWEEALAYCEDLELAGYTDWRLPNRIELFSLIDIKIVKPAISSEIFPNLSSESLWSSTSYNNTNAFYMMSSDGNIHKTSKTNTMNTLCVRAGL